MSSSKLNPIYAALDHHQYNRAIKLCLQQPADNIVAQALLAHSYAKSEQRPKALKILATLLLTHTTTSTTTPKDGADEDADYFAELRIQNKYAQTGIADSGGASTESAVPASVTPSGAATRKGAKKGKKKPAPTKAPIVAVPVAATVTPDWDWVDALDKPPVLPNNFGVLPAGPLPAALNDANLLSALQVTMSVLRLNLTAYQLYAWWVSTLTSSSHTTTPLPHADIIPLLRETFGLGLAVWMSPQYQALPVRQQILPQLQVFALQIARLEMESGQTSSVATLWAAQTALWQCQRTDEDQEPPVEANKLALLPRLAENLAYKIVHQTTEEPNGWTTEGFLLLSQTLELQNKWEAYLQTVDERLERAASSTDMNAVTVLSPAVLLKWKAKALSYLDRPEAARKVAEQSLREQNPDQWEMWLIHLDSDTTENYEATVNLARGLTLDTTDPTIKEYPRRGPPLAILEALKRRLEKTQSKEALLDDLVQEIQSYGSAFASRASCIFSDLGAYLDCIFLCGDTGKARLLVQWLQGMRQIPSAEEPAQRRAQLRSFIFANQTTLKILHNFPELQTEWLPDWKDLVRAWKDFQAFEDETKAAQTQEERMNAQKESRPADEIMLLAIQLLLSSNSSTEGLIMAATLLERAIEQSPDNAYLKMSAMFVYADLNAVPRSWDLYRGLFIKHIQHESCAFLILPLLQSAGMYQEVIEVCREILRLQTTALRDSKEYTGESLDNGTLSKADEFLSFQRNRMNKSLTTLEAKGLIMDCASLFKQDEHQAAIGSLHGVVGGDEDIERVHTMIAEAHNPLGTFSLLRLNGSVSENVRNLSENRDLNVLVYEVFRFRNFPSREDVVRDCIRRGHSHSLILRAALCIDSTKGPKKGKVVKPTAESSKRCRSLIARVDDAVLFLESESLAETGEGLVLLSLTQLCRAVAVLCGGFMQDAAPAEDSVSYREGQTAVFLQEALGKLQAARQRLDLSTSTSAIGRAIPEQILPLLALLNMCAKANDLYGWGKKRRTIRKCAGCLYDFMVVLRSVLEDTEAAVTALQLDDTSFSLPSLLKDGIVPDIIVDEDLRETLFLVYGAQGETQIQLQRTVDSVRSALTSFDTDE
jgi:tetratricopeptide (TPR) repeat protein